MERPPARPRPGDGLPWWRWAERPPRGHVPGARLPWASSIAVTAFVLVGSTFAAAGQKDTSIPLDPLGYALLLTASAVLLLRHRDPRLTVFVSAGACTVYLGVGYPYGPVFVAIALSAFNAVSSGHRRAALAALGVLWTGHLVTGHWLYRWLPPEGDTAVGWGQELGGLAWIAAIVAVSELVRVRREQWAREREEREEAERRRTDEERMRIARELHDVLAHSISVINVQAGVGLALLDSDPDQARTALTTIKSASKEALGEVRHVLDTLRTPGDAPRAPTPGLDRLPELVEQATRAGLRADVETEGEAAPLPPGTGLAAFRIIQEALTNVVRHSRARSAHVLLRYTPDELEIRVDDDGPASAEATSEGGNGLLGMRERAGALGGTVEAETREDGGFRVRARLPLVGADTVDPASGPAGAPGRGTP